MVVAISGCGGGDDNDEKGGDDAFKKVQQTPQKLRASKRAAPRWEPVAQLAGPGEKKKSFTIQKRAIQWRVRFSCARGRITFTLSPKPEGGPARVRKRCRKKGEESFIATGKIQLTVDAATRWEADVEQQVDTPLNEPPLPAMKGADVAASGRFYSVERKSRGIAKLYRLAGGRLALRFEDFKTSSNSDLFVWLSEGERPRTTKEVLRAPHREIELLKSTLGNQNYLLPRGVDESTARSIVIWCEPVLIAYGAASLASQ